MRGRNFIIKNCIQSDMLERLKNVYGTRLTNEKKKQQYNNQISTFSLI